MAPPEPWSTHSARSRSAPRVAKKAQLYSPTSPASDHDEDHHSSAPVVVSPAAPDMHRKRSRSLRRPKQQDYRGTDDVLSARGTDERGTEELRNTDDRGTEDCKGTDNVYDTEEGTDGFPRRGGKKNRATGPCPKLLAGTHLGKEVSLTPNHWVRIGRNPKATLLINNPGVSREHCSVRWDSHQRTVELRVETTAGTLVNGVQADSDRMTLEHADRLRVVGKGQNFDFVVDLRPVGLASSEPKKAARDNEKAKVGPNMRRAMIKARLHKLELDIRALDGSILESEREFYDIQAKRELRQAGRNKSEDQYKFYIEDANRLENFLDTSRKDWLGRLDEEYQKNEDDASDLIASTAGLQDKVEKLQLKKDELARSIHPEQYAVADVAVMENLVPMPSPTAMSGYSEPYSLADAGAPRRDEAENEGEDDAFAGLAGLDDDADQAAGGPSPASEDEGSPTALDIPQGGMHVESSPKRDGDQTFEDDEAPAKKLRHGGEGDMWLVQKKGGEEEAASEDEDAPLGAKTGFVLD